MPSLLLLTGFMPAAFLLVAATVPPVMDDPFQKAYSGVGGAFQLVGGGGKPDTHRDG